MLLFLDVVSHATPNALFPPFPTSKPQHVPLSIHLDLLCPLPQFAFPVCNVVYRLKSYFFGVGNRCMRGGWFE